MLPLIIDAILRNDLEKLQNLDESGENLENLETGRTPLFWAAVLGHAKIVDYLIRRGANVNFAESESGNTALLAAASQGNAESIQALIHAGAELAIQNKAGETILTAAVRGNNLELTQFLVSTGRHHGIDLVSITPKLLHLALVKQLRRGVEKQDVVEFLIEVGANINERDERGTTPLMLAARIGGSETIKFLLEKGANLNVKDNFGENCLWVALNAGRIDTFTTLVNANADVELRNRDGHTLLASAIDRMHPELVECLLDAGANADAKSSYDGIEMTPLERAQHHLNEWRNTRENLSKREKNAENNREYGECNDKIKAYEHIIEQINKLKDQLTAQKHEAINEINREILRIESGWGFFLSSESHRKGKVHALNQLIAQLKTPSNLSVKNIIEAWESMKSSENSTQTYRAILSEHRMGHRNRSDLTASAKLIDELKESFSPKK